MIRKAQFVLFLGLMVLSFSGFAKTVRYELTVTQQKINLSGKKEVSFALSVNGSIPAPTLEFTEGDDAEIVVHNRIPNGEELSIHWHGILLPPEEDGVSYVNTPPILANQSHTFRFKIRQHGTYWYHSHTMLQEQKGVYGAIVIHPKNKMIQADKDLVVVLSDWSDEDGDQILKNLRKDGDYYLYKKNSVRSYWGALTSGGLKNHLSNEWSRMGGMDLSDVGYDAFLMNGRKEVSWGAFRTGERIRLRLINAAASSYFYVGLGGQTMKVISADGVDVEPIETKEILMGMAETYDVLWTVPDQKSYELRATVQDITGFASGWLGTGEKVAAADKSMPDLYESMDHSHHGSHDNHGGHHGHAAVQAVPQVNVDQLKAKEPTAFATNLPVHDVKLVLGGDMERYVWHINGKAIHEDRNIEIRPNEVIRFTLVNETMMHHPMHLHGHFFRVLNANKEKSPLKHTVDVPPHQTRVIEFYSDEPGQWMLHCHNLYHMKTGMARVVKYSSWSPSPAMAAHEKHDPHLHDHWYAYGKIAAATNHAQVYLRGSNTWNQFELKVEGANPSTRFEKFEEEWESEADLLYRRWFGNYLNLTAGGVSFADRQSFVLGAAVILPMLIETQALVNQHGKWRLDIEKKFQWTRTWYSDVEWTWRPDQDSSHAHSNSELELSLMYKPQWSWAAGFLWTQRSIGLGGEWQF